MGNASAAAANGGPGLRLVTTRATPAITPGAEAQAAAYVTRFPVLGQGTWSRAAILEAGALFEDAHEDGYGAAAERLVIAVAPSVACRMLARLAAFPPAPRDALVAMVTSREPDQIRCVRAILLDEDPPEPEILTEWTDFKRRGAQLAQGVAARYPHILEKVAGPIGALHDVEILLRRAHEAWLPAYMERAS